MREWFTLIVPCARGLSLLQLAQQCLASFNAIMAAVFAGMMHSGIQNGPELGKIARFCELG